MKKRYACRKGQHNLRNVTAAAVMGVVALTGSLSASNEPSQPIGCARVTMRGGNELVVQTFPVGPLARPHINGPKMRTWKFTTREHTGHSTIRVSIGESAKMKEYRDGEGNVVRREVVA